ncbi:MAG: fructose-6-phosphate aldolase, partial [Candidatus Aminicenantes bacterium]|nr:fructose-6-phosphate aldolase [Candidatus Aminicenantes bacterium]
MKIFMDTANLDELKKSVEYGVVDGVTTNPSLIAKENLGFIPLIKEITTLIPGPVSVELTAMDFKGMMDQAVEYAGIAENVVIKVP